MNKNERQNLAHDLKANAVQPSLATLRPFFDELFERYHRAEWLSSDPIQFVHRYSEPRDKEVVGFLAACFAYGSVVLVHRAVEGVLKPMGASPSRFIEGFDGKNYWEGFYHRFHDDGHVLALVKTLQKILKEHGTLGAFFRSHYSGSVESVLNGAGGTLRETALSFVKGRRELERGIKFFINTPNDGSACKRMLMFLRWMVRSDEVDVGLWAWFPKDKLVIPVDTHIARLSFYLRLRQGAENRTVNWKMACEITENLKQFNAADPVKYDFALARLGILDICKRKYAKSVCERCPVEPGCRYSNLRE